MTETVSNGTTVCDFTEVELPGAVKSMLDALKAHQGQALSREKLAELTGRSETYGDRKVSRVIDVTISRVRKELEGHGLQIKSIRGVGYMLTT